jgi:hypothetical protein
MHPAALMLARINVRAHIEVTHQVPLELAVQDAAHHLSAPTGVIFIIAYRAVLVYLISCAIIAVGLFIAMKCY